MMGRVPVRSRTIREAGAGSVFAIPIDDAQFGFGQVAEGLDVACFDYRSKTLPAAAEIAGHRVAFRVPVADDAPTVGRWKLLGKAPLHGPLRERARYRHQPVGSDVSLVYSNRVSRPATPTDEVEKLEVLATWFAEHIQSRLQDHFAGRPNVYVQTLELPPKYP